MMFRMKKTRFPAHILHVTDTEGTGYLARAMARSRLVTVDPFKGFDFADPGKKSFFIFGGDAVGWGKECFRDLAWLLDFKERYPDRVILIAGNRDIINNRFWNELHPSRIRERLLCSESPRWQPSRKTVPIDYIVAGMRERQLPCKEERDIRAFVSALSVMECQLIYLRWMLAETMGSPQLFRFVREALEAGETACHLTDENVLARILSEAAPEGLMGKYLQRAQLAAIVPDTGVLVVHGGVMPGNIGRVPGGFCTENAEEWVSHLNLWYAGEVEKWVKRCTDGVVLPDLQPAPTALDEVSLPLEPRSVVVGNMLDDAGRFAPPSDGLCHWLQKNRIRMVLTGHNPYGDHPVVLRSQSDRVLFVLNDTSYANVDRGNTDSMRGIAAHTTEITGDRQCLQLHIAADLITGIQTQTHLTVSDQGVMGDPWMGLVTPDHAVVQCRLPDGSYQLARKEGPKKLVETRVTEEELRQRFGTLSLKAKL